MDMVYLGWQQPLVVNMNHTHYAMQGKIMLANVGLSIGAGQPRCSLLVLAHTSWLRFTTHIPVLADKLHTESTCTMLERIVCHHLSCCSDTGLTENGSRARLSSSPHMTAYQAVTVHMRQSCASFGLSMQAVPHLVGHSFVCIQVDEVRQPGRP